MVFTEFDLLASGVNFSTKGITNFLNGTVTFIPFNSPFFILLSIFSIFSLLINFFS